ILTSSTGIRARIASATRPSMPSYRPQANTSHGSVAYRAAMSWVNGTPLGVGTTSRAGTPTPSAGMISSSASPQTSGFITMPGPPPNGRSSTVWCTSFSQRRKSCTRNSMSPRAAAFPISETPSGLAKYSGKIVTMSMRSPTLACLLLSRTGCGALRCLRVEQSGGRVDDENPARHIDLRHDRLHERHQALAALAVRAAYHQEVLAVVEHVGDHAYRLARAGPHRQADQLVVAELVRVTDLRQLAGVHAQPAAGQLGGRSPVGDPGEPDEKLSGVPAHRGDRQLLATRGLLVMLGDLQGGAHGKPEVRLVGPDPDHDLAADPVRTADAADDYPHRVSGSRWRPAGRSGRSGPPPGRRSQYAALGRCARPGR